MLEKEVSPLIFLSSSIPASSFHPPLFSAHRSSSCLPLSSPYLSSTSICHSPPFTLSPLLSSSFVLLSFFFKHSQKARKNMATPPFNHRFVLQPLFFFLFLKITNLSLPVFFIYIYLRPLSLLSAQQAVIFPAGRWQTAISNSLSWECWEVNIVTDTTGSWCCGHSGAPSQTRVRVRRNGRQTEGGRDVPAESENRDVVES